VSRAARAVLGSAVALLAVAGCTTTTAGSGQPAVDATVSGGASRPALPSPSGSSAPTPAGTGGEVVSFGKLRMPLPAGSTAKVDGELLCVTLADDDGCSLEVLDVGRVRAAGGPVSIPAPGEEYGWWWGSDAPSCGESGEVSAVTRSAVAEKGFKKIGPKTAAYGRWRVTCEDTDLNFTARLWWLPTSQLAFRQRGTAAGTGGAVDKLLAGVTFGA